MRTRTWSRINRKLVKLDRKTELITIMYIRKRGVQCFHWLFLFFCSSEIGTLVPALRAQSIVTHKRINEIDLFSKDSAIYSLLRIDILLIEFYRFISPAVMLVSDSGISAIVECLYEARSTACRQSFSQYQISNRFINGN